MEQNPLLGNAIKRVPTEEFADDGGLILLQLPVHLCPQTGNANAPLFRFRQQVIFFVLNPAAR